MADNKFQFNEIMEENGAMYTSLVYARVYLGNRETEWLELDSV